MLFNCFGILALLQILPALAYPPCREQMSDPYEFGESDLMRPGMHDTPLSLMQKREALAISLSKRDSVGSYAPYNVTCPSDYMLRPASDGISSGEQSFIDKRIPKINTQMRSFISNTGLDVDVNSVINDSDGPRLGLAFSGGGLRAMVHGGGVLNAFDSRNGNGSSLAGILQSAMYIAGLSGGSWLVGSVAVNNFANITYLRDNVWNLEHSVFAPHGDNVVENLAYYDDLDDEIDQKKDAGFDTSLTDLWGRALSRKLVDATQGGPNITFSSIRNQTWFQNADYPYPIIISDSRLEEEKAIPANTSIFEFTPYEFGTWDNGIKAFLPMEYVGTHLKNGVPPDHKCIRNYDNAGFVMGTSATLFNTFLLEWSQEVTSNSTLYDIIHKVFEKLSEDQNDIAPYPNPYQNFTTTNTTVKNPFERFDTIDLVDGGEDDENIPIWPLLHPQRFVDVIFAVDATYDDSNGWPDGSSIVTTYERIITYNANKSVDVRGFPYIPDEDTIISLGLNTHPTFFGCDGRNTTAGNHTVDNNTPPLLVYFPNYPWVYYSNISTFTMSMNDTLSSGILENAALSATQNNSDSFAVCLACAMIQRSLERKNMSTPSQCSSCFEQYCWNGTTVNNPSAVSNYAPTVLSASTTSGTSSVRAKPIVFYLFASLLTVSLLL
ncbi:lysophospholipase Plb3 [Schizosaccharomyces pombe]|uniref:Probable lysophospholipase 3 n=1 Tax=Schizosaccharomyces pombe (strain 972 / ATCC 24843) TaxID=284812 RepID=PLB3_SCHPO|nr:RecName: Full=Putative lysophospholipase SPAC1A6.03c; AltName: Full=Phospholipase B; Flags: Precursor [Schizosaccharomyces pombe 972h-]